MSKNFNLAYIIDDNEIDSFILERIISDTQFSKKVIINEWAQDALDYLKDNDHQDGVLPEFIFLDLNMPLMSGFEFLDEYQKLPPRITAQIKIVIVSTSYHIQDRERALNHPHVYGYILKPASHEQIKLLLEDLTMAKQG